MRRRLFLLALAIIDDIGAIVVVVMRRLRITQPIAYLVPALGLWLLLHES